MATLAVLRDELRDILTDGADTRWSLAIKDRYLNEGQAEVVKRGRLLTAVATLAAAATTPTTAFYTLPTDFLAFQGAGDPVGGEVVRDEALWLNGKPLSRIGLAYFRDRVSSWEAEVGVPWAYLFGHREKTTIQLYPYSVAAQNPLPRLFYVRQPAVLSDPAHVPEINSAYHKALVRYAVWACYTKDAQTHDERKGAQYLAMFEADLAGLMQDLPSQPRTIPTRYV